MQTGRADYDAMLRQTSIPEDEPRFLLRAQDVVGADAVRAWAALARAAGVPAAVLEQALRQADAMDAWPRKKVADGAHLDEATAKQLAYEHSRRAWNANDATGADPRLALAEQRGWDAAQAEVRALKRRVAELEARP